MELDWKGIFEKTLVAVLAGLILAGLAWVYGTVTAEKTKTLTAEVEWIDITNVAYRMDRKLIPALDKALADAFGPSNLATYMSSLGYQSIARVLMVTIKNAGDTRTKEIEVSAKQGAIFSYKSAEPISSVIAQIKIKPIDPKGRAIAYVVMPPWSFYESVPISILHDGRLVDVEARTLSETEWDMFKSLRDSPVYIAIAFILAAIGFMTLLIGLIAGFLSAFFKQWMFSATGKSISPKTLRLYLDLIGFARANNPEKISAAEALPSMMTDRMVTRTVAN